MACLKEVSEYGLCDYLHGFSSIRVLILELLNH